MKKIRFFPGIWDLGFGICSEPLAHDLSNLGGVF